MTTSWAQIRLHTVKVDRGAAGGAGGVVDRIRMAGVVVDGDGVDKITVGHTDGDHRTDHRDQYTKNIGIHRAHSYSRLLLSKPTAHNNPTTLLHRNTINL